MTEEKVNYYKWYVVEKTGDVHIACNLPDGSTAFVCSAPNFETACVIAKAHNIKLKKAKKHPQRQNIHPAPRKQARNEMHGTPGVPLNWIETNEAYEDRMGVKFGVLDTSLRNRSHKWM